MSLKEDGNDTAMQHPNPIDKNRSIVWARYHVDSNEWALLAVKVTRRQPGQVPTLVTVALVDHAGRTLVEEMVKASHVVSNEEIVQHGVDQSVVFRAKSFEEVVRNLVDNIGDKTLVAWDMDEIQGVFDELSTANGVQSIAWKGHSASKEFARFIGHTDDPKNGYETQPLPVLGLSAADECRAILKAIKDMAGASQMTDAVANGKPGWTAEFYRPKVGTKDKLKGLFGINS